VFDLDTAVHDHFQASRGRLSRHRLMHHADLHPEDFSADFERLTDEGKHRISTAKNIHWKKIGQQLAPHAAPEGLDGGGQ
jgi:hypothetical protein